MMNRREFLRGMAAIAAGIALAPIVASKVAAKEVLERWRPLTDREKEDILAEALESDEGLENMANAMTDDFVNDHYVIKKRHSVPTCIVEGEEIFVPAFRGPRFWERAYWIKPRPFLLGKKSA